MKVKIKGTGSAVPKLQISNDDLAEIMDTSDEWIASRTGIRNRRIACEETTGSMACEAARKALEDGGGKSEEVELIIVATFSPEKSVPNTASQVQKELNCPNAVAFDLNAACSGFLFALNTVQAYFSAGIYRNALVIGSETISKAVDWEDRATCVLFGDGAGAAYVTAEDGEPMQFIQKSDGSQGEVLELWERQNENPWHPAEKNIHKLTMDGQAVFRFAVRKVPECILELLERVQKTVEEVDYFLLHQANYRILEAVCRRLAVPFEKFPMNLDKYGNTSAASIPILLDEVKHQGVLKEGDQIILSGFGAGLTWGAALLQW